MILEVKGLKVGFEAETAVDGIDFAVGEDEVVGLVGESGSGKTVTALSVMRLLPAGGRIEGGSILFERDDLLKLSERDMLEVRGRSISMIFQEPFTSLNPVLRIGEQISEVMAAHGALSKKAAYDETLRLLRMVRIDDPERVFYDYPHRLSGGQRQRVMIATALALKPRILIADEPTTALDVTIQSEILQLLIELKREFGTAVLFITHDFGVVNEIADRVLVMKAGKIVEEGRKNELLRSPRHPYTKRLLDAYRR